MTVGNQSNEYLITQYNTFYAYNTVSPIDNDGSRFGDNHWGDWERVSVIAQRPKGSTADWEFLAIITRSHTNPLKTKKTPETYEKTQKKVYSALHAHGTFNSCTDLDPNTWGDLRDDDGVAWNLRDAPNEIIEYHNYWFGSKSEFNSTEALANSVNKDGTSYYRKQWTHFAGPWGPSRTSENDKLDYSVIVPGITVKSIWIPFTGNSPWSREMRVSDDELVELGKLL